MAAGDFNKPANASLRTSFMQEIRDLVKDVSRMLNPDTSTSNIPVGGIRRNPTTKKFEEWSGTAWGDLPLTGQLVGNATVIKSAYTTGGSATAYTATIPEVTALVSGDTYFVKAHIANTTTSPTLAISGLAAKTIKKEGGAALVAGDLPINHEAIFRYNGTDMILVNPVVPTNADTVDSYHASQLAKLGGNVFTDSQSISMENPLLVFNDSVGTSWAGKIYCKRANVTKAVLAFDADTNYWHFRDASENTTIIFNSTTGTMLQGTVPLARMMRTEVQGSAVSLPVDLDMGTVVTGDRIFCTGIVRSGTLGGTYVRVTKGSGSATVDFAGHDSSYGLVAGGRSDISNVCVSGICRVTTGGTLTLTVAAGGWTSPTIYGHAIVLNNG